MLIICDQQMLCFYLTFKLQYHKNPELKSILHQFKSSQLF